MPFPTELAGIAGAQELHDWFGRWPQFHDSEVLSLHLNRIGSSVLTVHAWDMTDKVDSGGFYVLQKHIIVRFLLDGITESSFEDFNHHNVLFGLPLTKQDGGFNLTLDSSFGQRIDSGQERCDRDDSRRNPREMRIPVSTGAEPGRSLRRKKLSATMRTKQVEGSRCY